MAEYLQRLAGRAAAPRDAKTWRAWSAYARQEKWPRRLVQSLKTFLTDMGVDERRRREHE